MLTSTTELLRFSGGHKSPVGVPFLWLWVCQGSPWNQM